MKDLKKVKEGFFKSADVELFRELEDAAARLRESVVSNCLPILTRAIAIMSEQWRVKNEPDTAFTERLLEDNSVNIAKYITNGILDKKDAKKFLVITTFFFLDDSNYDNSDLGSYIENNAADIVEEYHGLFDD